MAAKPDLSEFFKYSRPKKPPCKIGFSREQLGDEERAQLDAALNHDQGVITNTAIEQWLAARKQAVTVSAVVAHRKGRCSCGGS